MSVGVLVGVPAGFLEGGGRLDDGVPGAAYALRKDNVLGSWEVQEDCLGELVDVEGLS